MLKSVLKIDLGKYKRSTNRGKVSAKQVTSFNIALLRYIDQIDTEHWSARISEKAEQTIVNFSML